MDETAALTPGAHRSIRMLDAQESAYPGELITDGERRGVRVDVEAVPEPLWLHAGAEHVAGVRDLLRRPDGHDAVLPWCADRIEVFLGRRAAVESALSAGETVTLVGSLLRGIVEIGDRSLTGQWWLTDEARPVFAPGEGVACTASAVALIARLREGCPDRALNRLLGEIETAAGDQRMVRRSIERWERELTELAAPRALVREVFAPERVVAIDAHAVRLDQDADLLAAEPGALGRVQDRLIEAGQDMARRLRTGLRRDRRAVVRSGRPGEPAARAPRGRMLIVGGAAAALVLVGGLMWPTGKEDSAATERVGEVMPAVTPTAAPDAAPERDVETSEAPDAMIDGSAEQRAAALLTTVLECGRRGDAVCADAIVDGAGAAVQERLAGTEAKRTIAAVEDYGDVGVLRLGESGQRGEQMLVLVMQKDRWLVRDVYDVANQPSGQG
ncbi:hypothetical protein CW368_01615 [Actinomycetales bacterium SN12]|nr:hypothetical protein CW368_01615 [Actinomycetales bacterium SN12]